MAKVRIYQKPAGIPVNTSVFAVEILQNNIWYTRKVSWETLKGLIAGAESLVFANGTLTFTTPDGVAHQVLSVDSEVTPNSVNPVSGGAVNTALAGKQDTLTFDQVPTDGSTNPVESNGIFDALALKQDVLTFDTTPTDGSTNPVTSAGIYAAVSAITTGIDWKEAVATYADIATTYPNPQDGWTVTTLDDDHTYRYTGTEWVDMFSLITQATAEKDGLMSAADFTKLAGIEAQANKTVVSDTLTPSTTTKKLATVSGGGSSTDILGDDADKILRAAFGEHTATGNPVSVDAFLGLEVVSSCKVTMLPIQDISQGDPSPTNICPISGRDSVNVENDPYYPYSVVWNQLIKNGNFTDNTNWNERNTGNLTIADGKCTLTALNGNATNQIYQNMTWLANHVYMVLINVISYSGSFTTLSIGFYNGTTSSEIQSVQKSSLTANWGMILKPSANSGSSSNFRIGFRTNNAQGDKLVMDNIMIFDLTVMFGTSVADSIYAMEQTTAGSGVAKCREYGIIKEYYAYNSGEETYMGLVNDEWHYSNSHTYSTTVYGGVDDFVSGVGSNEWGYIASYNGETLPDIWLSDRDAYAPNTTPTTGAEVVYKLATPTQITNTPEDITLLKGVNVVSTDGDSLELKYSADIKAYIDSKLNA